MTTNYLKVNPKVVEALGLSRERNRLPDGNYLLFWRELRNLGLGGLMQYGSVMERVGAVALTPAEAVAEQNGSACKPLPAATDPAYYVEPQGAPEEDGLPEEDSPSAEDGLSGEDTASPEDEQQGEDESAEGGDGA